jgi:hypothetical protein
MAVICAKRRNAQREVARRCVIRVVKNIGHLGPKFEPYTFRNATNLTAAEFGTVSFKHWCVGSLFLPACPSSVIVIDQGQGKIVHRIELETGTPLGLLSSNHKRVHVTTVDHNGH